MLMLVIRQAMGLEEEAMRREYGKSRRRGSGIGCRQEASFVLANNIKSSYNFTVSGRLVYYGANYHYKVKDTSLYSLLNCKTCRKLY